MRGSSVDTVYVDSVLLESLNADEVGLSPEDLLEHAEELAEHSGKSVNDEWIRLMGLTNNLSH